MSIFESSTGKKGNILYLFPRKSRSSLDNDILSNKSKSETRSKCMERFTSRLCRPLRIFQFLTTLVLFAMIVYMAAMSFRHMTHLASILLIILTSSYLFFMAVDIISQFGPHALPDSPMFLFSLLGILLFAIAGGLMVHYKSSENNFWALVLARILCFVISALFLIEVTMLLVYWRQKCIAWQKCYPYTPTCRQSETRKLFLRDHERDVEVGRQDVATCISQFGVLEDTGVDTAVLQHGCRKICVGHRRQYVDCQSSVPMLSIVQIAQIQTENEPTAISECQTQRTETREILIQTTSRCELCHRQMGTVSGHLPPPSQASSTQYPSPSRRPEQPPLTPEVMPVSQRGHCAACPAFLNIMRGGIASPCCHSCNCGATQQYHPPVPYLLDHTVQEPEIHSPQWSQPEVQQTPRSSGTVKATGSESPTTTNEKSDAERDLAIEEGNRYRPSRKLSRVYETHPCPTHGAGLAARNAGLPEIVTRVTLSSIYMNRDKKSQIPKKNDSPVSTEVENNKEIVHSSSDIRKKEQTASGKNIVNEPEELRNEAEENVPGVSFDKIGTGSKTDDKSQRLSEDSSKSTNELEMGRSSEERKSYYRPPRKLYRDSETLLKSPDPMSPPDSIEIDRQGIEKVRVPSTKQESKDEMLWRSDESELRESNATWKNDSWLDEALQIKEEPEEDSETEQSKPQLTFQESIIKEEPGKPKGSREKTIKENRGIIDSQESRESSGPILKLRLDNPAEDLKLPESEKSDEVISRSKTLESRSILRSRSNTGRLSKTDSEISPQITEDPSEIPIRGPRKSEDEMTPTRLKEEKVLSEISESEFEGRLKTSGSRVPKQFSTSSRISRNKSLVRGDEGSDETLRRPKIDASTIIHSPESKASFVSQESLQKIEREKSQSFSDWPREHGESIEEESIRLETNESGERPEKSVEKSRFSEPKAFAVSSKTSRTKPSIDKKSDGIKSGSDVRIDGRGSLVRTDEGSVATMRRLKNDVSTTIGSPDSKASFVSQERLQKIKKEKSQSYSDWPREHRESIEEESMRLETDASGERIEKSVEKSRTKPSIDKKSDGIKSRSNVRIDGRDSLIRQSLQKGFREIEKRKSSFVQMPRSSREASVIATPRRETKRDESIPGDFAYVQASWSPTVTQGSSRGDSVEQQDRSRISEDPSIGRTGRPDRPSGQCMENSTCLQPPRFGMEFEGVTSVCPAETVCVEPCSCRIKSLLLQQRSLDPQYPRYHPVQPSIEPRHLTCEIEMPHAQCPGRRTCPQARLAWGCTRHPHQTEYYDSRSRADYGNRTRPKRNLNLCYVS